MAGTVLRCVQDTVHTEHSEMATTVTTYLGSVSHVNLGIRVISVTVVCKFILVLVFCRPTTVRRDIALFILAGSFAICPLFGLRFCMVLYQ